MNVTIDPIDAGSDEAQRLIAELDRYLLAQYPGQPTNGIDVEEFRAAGGYFVVVREAADEAAVGCGAFRPVSVDCVEIKRIFILASHRRRGHARRILEHLEAAASAAGYRGIVLETGTMQPESIQLYETADYFRIPKYGQFVGSRDSLCYAKQL